MYALPRCGLVRNKDDKPLSVNPNTCDQDIMVSVLGDIQARQSKPLEPLKLVQLGLSCSSCAVVFESV